MLKFLRVLVFFLATCSPEPSSSACTTTTPELVEFDSVAEDFFFGP